MPGRFLAVGAAAVVGMLAAAGGALGAPADEQALAEKFAPVLRLVAQEEECGPGEPFDPLDVAALLAGDPTVALRGPWRASDLVKIGPEPADLVDRFEYHLDFPGDALDPGCAYERWSRRLSEGAEPVVYAHVASEPARPGKLALQYWLFYAFNDFNNTHEGDWEMIQLVFDADDPAQALSQVPVRVGYSSHEGAEGADWGDDRLAVVEGTHPVVYPGAGSHANKFTEALYLGSSAEAGVGCDDTRGPHRELRPTVKTIPSDPAAASAAFPWIDFEGRWGELQPAFFNGPTGPNLKTQWREPITWSETWRDRSFAVPAAGLLGTGATDLFCGGVAKGSRALVLLLRSPAETLLVVLVLLAAVALVVVRATWTPATPVRVLRRRSWGQILSASACMYLRRPLLFLGLGAVLVPITLVTTLVQWLIFTALGALGVDLTGEAAGTYALVAVLIGAALALFGLALVQAATACALVELDAGRTVGPVAAYRHAVRRWRPLLGAVTIVVAGWVALTTTTLLLPVAVWLVVRWCLVAPVTELEDVGVRGALRRSGALLRARWFRVASLVGLSSAVALVAGPLVGALLIFATDAPLQLLNVVAGVVYALVVPYAALVTAYVYFDARVRLELEVESPAELPAELTWSTPR